MKKNYENPLVNVKRFDMSEDVTAAPENLYSTFEDVEEW